MLRTKSWTVLSEDDKGGREGKDVKEDRAHQSCIEEVGKEARFFG